MRDREKALAILDQQYGAYQTMYTLGLQQRGCLEHEDLVGLEASFVQVEQLMNQIRLRQAGLPALDREDAEIQDRIGKLRDIILKIQDLRESNQRSVKCLMDQTRDEIRQLGKGKQAHRGYRKSPVFQARLFDGTR